MKNMKIRSAQSAPVTRSRRPVVRAWLTGLWFALLAGTDLDAYASSPIYVVVNVANPATEFSRKDVLGMYMGRIHSFANGDRIVALDLPRESETRVRFYKLLTGMSLAQVNTYWARLIFTGQTLAPQPEADETAMLDAIRRNPDAIGYLSSTPAGSDVRVVFVLDDEP